GEDVPEKECLTAVRESSANAALPDKSSPTGMESDKILQRTSSLLQNKAFTGRPYILLVVRFCILDVTFIVGPPSASKKYVGHRVLLAMTSPVFEAMFYGDMADKSKVIRISDIAPIGFENLLRYAYTDNLKLETVDDAMFTAFAAKKYILPHLLKDCFAFIEKNVTPATVCQVFEFASVMEAYTLIYQCLNIIDRQTYHVLTSENFVNVQATTLETIVHRKYLNLYSEYALYQAAVQWSTEECNRRGIDKSEIENVRICMGDTVVSQIRFLALSPEEFTKGPARSGLLSRDECYAVFMNMAIPGIVNLPKGISAEGTKRLSPPENFTARRYQAVSFHPPSRPVRFIGLRFTVLTRDIFITGLGFPLRQDLGSYSVRTHKYDGMLRCSYRIQEDRREREECEVAFTLSKDKDVKLKLTRPFFIRKGLEYELELQLSHVVSDDVIIPSLKNRRKEDNVEGVTIVFGQYQRPHMSNVIEMLEISDLFFYF
ncbi:BTB/POZ domain-containing protein 6-B-like, partial [Tropilaelaps mercedesae]